MAQNLSAIPKFLDLAYQADISEFNRQLPKLLKESDIKKAELPRLLYEHLRSGKDMPTSSKAALGLLTAVPTGALRKSPVYDALLKLLDPADKKQIPYQTSVWGPHGVASYPMVSMVLSGDTLETILGKTRVEAFVGRAEARTKLAKRWADG